MDIDSDIESEEELDWLLGFAEAARHSRDLLRHAFPSKIGGRPAWLDPLHLPTKEQLTCSTSGSTLQFLLQVGYTNTRPINNNVKKTMPRLDPFLKLNTHFLCFFSGVCASR